MVRREGGILLQCGRAECGWCLLYGRVEALGSEEDIGGRRSLAKIQAQLHVMLRQPQRELSPSTDDNPAGGRFPGVSTHAVRGLAVAAD